MTSTKPPSGHLFPDVWLRVSPGGYGYVDRVPCRVIGQTAARLKIRIPKDNGDVVDRYVKPENVEIDARLF